MYSTTINRKVDLMFENLRKKVADIVLDSSTSTEAITSVTKLVSSELATRSKSILSDMLFELSDSLMKTDFFADIERQNKFYEINLRQEILNKYRYTPSTTVNYKIASREIQALKTGGVVLGVGSAVEIGTVLVAGLSLSNLVPVPIGVLIVASIGAALTDYYVIEPTRSKKSLAQALDNYLINAKKQFLEWFDEVRNF